MANMFSEAEMERLRLYIESNGPDIARLTADERQDLAYLCFKQLVGETLAELGLLDHESGLPAAGERDPQRRRG